jgi:WD40 repeat protein
MTRIIKAHTSTITALDLDPFGEILATGGIDQLIRLWKISDLNSEGSDSTDVRPYAVFQGHTERVSSLHFSGNGKSLLSSSLDGTVRIWGVHPTPETNVLTGAAKIVDFSSDSRHLIAVHRDGRLYDWEVFGTPSARLLNIPTQPSSGCGLAISSEAKLLALGRPNGAIELWDLENSSQRPSLAAKTKADEIRFSKNGRFLISAQYAFDGEGRIRVNNLTTGRDTVLANATSPFALSPDGSTLATYRPDRTGIALWQIANGQLLRVLPTETWTGGLAFSPDGKVLAQSTFPENSIRLWNLASGHSTRTRVKETGGIRLILFSPDGQMMVVCTYDNAVSFWQMRTGDEIMREVAYHDGPFAFSPNGECLAFVGKWGPTGHLEPILWRAPSLAYIDASQAVAAREDRISSLTFADRISGDERR